MAIRKLGIVGIAAAALLAAGTGPIQAQSVKIGYLSDLTGAGSTLGGESSIPAIKMAIEDFGGTALGKPIELIVADTLNKPDVGLGIA
ncbi:MAG: ABC transporter substrate-binding protein, partial [Flavobacteriaceae bacterium]